MHNFFIMAFFFATSIQAATVPPESNYKTIIWTLKATEKNSDVLKAEQQRVRAVKEQYNQANSFTRPRITTNGSIGHSQIDDDTGQNNLVPRTSGLAIEQPLYRGGRTVAAKRKANADIAQAEALYKDLQQDVFLQAIEAHARVLEAQKSVILFQQNQFSLEENLEAIQTRFDYQQVTNIDLAQAKSRLSQAIADTIQAEGNLIQANAEFMEVVGVDAEKLQNITLLSPLPVTQTIAEEQALVQSLPLKAAKKAIASADYNVKQERGTLLPEVLLVGGANYNRETSAIISRQDNLDITARLTLPLYQGGLLRSRIRAAHATLKSQEYNKNAVQRNVQKEIINAWTRARVAKTRLDSLENAMEASQVALDSLQQETLAGTRTVIDLLNAEQEFLAAQISLLNGQTEKTIAEYAVLKQLVAIKY